jgi:type IV pilus assembly protein PilC
MPSFSYTAKTNEGRRVQGQLQAENLNAARTELSPNHTIVYRLEEKSDASGKLKFLYALSPVHVEDLIGFSQAIASMSDSGISLKRTIDILLEDTENATMLRVLSDVSEDLAEGETLAQSLSRHSAIFPSYYVAMTEAGESSGNLPEMMTRLAEILTAVEALESRAKAALSYPLLLFAFTLVSFLAFFAYGSPYLEAIYTSLGVEAPLLTRTLLALGVTMGNLKLELFFLTVFVFYLIWSLPRREKSRIYFDKLRLSLPILGGVFRVLYTARFMRTMSVLHRSGLGLAQSVRLAAAAIGNYAIAEELFDLSLKLEKGEELSDTLRESAHVSRMAVGMIAAGEESGKLDTMLTRVAEVYEVKTSTLMQNVRSRLEPALMLVLGLAVAGFLSMMGWPLIQLLSS